MQLKNAIFTIKNKPTDFYLWVFHFITVPQDAVSVGVEIYRTVTVILVAFDPLPLYNLNNPDLYFELSVIGKKGIYTVSFAAGKNMPYKAEVTVRGDTYKVELYTLNNKKETEDAAD